MQLLQHFKDLTLDPKNAKELKGLILQLAIQGKLTANWRKDNPDVESASELLKRIESEKTPIIKGKLIKKENPLNEISTGEIPFKISEKWKWVRLRNLGTTATGGTPSKSNHLYFGDDIPFLKPGDIKNGIVNYNNEGLSFLGKEKLGRSAPKDSILMVCLGTIGKCAIIDRTCTFNQQINSIYSEKINVNYLFYALSSKYFYDIAWKNSTSTTIALLNKSNWEKIPIPIPPFEEQQEIVRVVEILFKEVEQLEQLTKERIALKEDFVTSALRKLTTENTSTEWDYLQNHFKSFFTEKSAVKKLREAVLQLAVQGKLTVDWRKNNSQTEPATVLLKRIQKEKAQLIKDKKIKKESPLPPISDDEVPYELPERWVWCRLLQVTDIIAGASFNSNDFNEISGTKCIKITNAGVRHFVETYDYLPETFKDLYSNFLINEGDLVIALTRPYIKDGLKISTCPSSYNNSLLNQRVAAIRSFTNLIYHPYIFTFIQSPNVLNFFKEKFDDKSQQPNMKMGDLTNLLISLPPIEEQRAIVQKLNALMLLCDKLEQEIEQSKNLNEQLMKSVLREVFNDKKEVENA